MRRLLFLAALLAPLAAGPARAGELSPEEEAMLDWRGSRNAQLREKFRAARRLAETKTLPALKELLAEFDRPARNQDKFRELTAPHLARAFDAPEFAPILREALTERLRGPEHCWLAHQVAVEWLEEGRPTAAYDLVLRGTGLPFHQAAVLRALAVRPDAGAYALAQDVIATLPAEEPARSVLLTAAARVVETNAPVGDDVALRAVLEPIFAQLDDPRTTRRTATVLGRSIARTVDSDVVYAEASSWRQFLDDRRVAEKLAKEGYAPSRSYFAGVLLTGRDIVYVIDSSGSMRDPFTWRPTAPEEMETPATPSAPKTARDRVEEERRRREAAARREQDVFKSLDALPWDKIKSKLDAVRESLKASIRALQPDQRFAVVVFSNDARLLRSTPRLTPVAKDAVDAACLEIDQFVADGATNVHRALELAFGTSRGRLEDPASGTNAEHLLGGADTIVLLTDGTPTTDSYDMRGEHSLYATLDLALLAARRWNLLMDAELDGVGLLVPPRRPGELSPVTLLDAFARLGSGRTRFLGALAK